MRLTEKEARCEAWDKLSPEEKKAQAAAWYRLSKEAKKAEIAALAKHQQHETGYMQSILDAQAAQKAEGIALKIKARLQKRLKTTEAYALTVLQKMGIDTVPKWTAFVTATGAGCGGDIPKALQDCFSGGVPLSEIADDAQRAMVSLHILAFTRYVLNAEKPEAWAMFEISSALSEAIFALNNKARRQAYLRKQGHDAGKQPVWYTKPLIAMCKQLRERHPYATASDIFKALPDARTVKPITRVAITDFDGSLLIEAGKTRHHDKSIKQQQFSKFLTKHRDTIGRKKGLLSR